MKLGVVVVDDSGPWPVSGLLEAIEALQAVSLRAEATSGVLGRVERTLATSGSTGRPNAAAVLQYRGTARR